MGVFYIEECLMDLISIRIWEQSADYVSICQLDGGMCKFVHISVPPDDEEQITVFEAMVVRM